MKLDFSTLSYELTLENLLELLTFIIDSSTESFTSPSIFDAQAFFPVIEWAKRTISPREVELLLRDSQIAVESLPRLPSQEVSPLHFEKYKLLSFFNLLSH